MTATDEILHAKIQSEELDDFELVFRKHYPTLLAFTTEYLPDPDAARDIVQDSFMVLWEQKHTLQPGSNFRAYLFTIARNKSLNYLKRRIKAPNLFTKPGSNTW